VAASQKLSVGALATAPASVDRERTRGDIRLILAIIAVLDLMVIVVAVILGGELRVVFDVWSPGPIGGERLVAQATPWIIGSWLAALVAQGAYRSRHFGAGPDEFRAVLVATLTTASLVGIGCYLLNLPLSRGFVATTFLIGTPLLVLQRYSVRKIVHRMRMQGRLLHRVIAVGGPSGISEVVDALQRNDYVGYRVVGACVPSGLGFEPDRFSVPVLGSVQDTRRLCDEVGADTVLVARGYETSQELRRIAWALEGSSIDLIVVPSLTDVAGPRIHMRPVAGLPLLHVEQPQAGEAGGLAKRLFDLVGAATALALLSPIMLAVAIAIWSEDHGPVFFKQPRIGRDGLTFGCFKLRSMFVNADQMEQKLREETGHSGALWKMEQDPRITRVGRFIRRYSIDELPQLFNVVLGEMSLVGPRPQQAWEVETYTDWEGRRLRVRPGMTGLWQVSGRSQLSFDEAIRLDLYYVDNWSMMSDLIIMAKTVRAVLGSAGAY
jgi:exopolysaccharide biosynthesis polyprenyl glycosylphosphotransferase